MNVAAMQCTLVQKILLQLLAAAVVHHFSLVFGIILSRFIFWKLLGFFGFGFLCSGILGEC